MQTGAAHERDIQMFFVASALTPRLSRHRPTAAFSTKIAADIVLMSPDK